MQRSLKSKIIVPTVIILILLAITIIAYSSITFLNFNSLLFQEKIVITANGLQDYLRNCEDSSRAASISMAANAEVIKAVKKRDTKEILRLLNSRLKLYHVNFYTITNERGIVLARTDDPDNSGNSIAEQQNIKDALAGNVSTHYEEGAVAKVSVRTSAPVYDTDGTLIGVVSAGLRFDTDEAVSNLKKLFGADFTVFWGDTRVATTVERKGKNIIGTKLDPQIAKIVFEDKEKFLGNADIMGENYSAYYFPLINHQGDAFAALFAGHSNAHFIKEGHKIIIGGIMIGISGIVVSILMLLFIISRKTKPVKQLTNLVSEVAQGNVNIDVGGTHSIKDEIDLLMQDVYLLINIIKSISGDVSQLTKELNNYSDIKYQIDASKYGGIYKEIIEDIKTLGNSVSMMNKVMTAMDSLDSMINVVDLDYNFVYANRSLLNTFGLDPEHYKGKKCYKALRNLDQPCSMCLLPVMLPEKDKFPSEDYEFLYDEVHDIWISGKASIIRWVDGSTVYFQSLNDETKKKMAQEQLNEAVKAAKTALTAKSAFFANMSHELRTPLNVIVGLADLQLESTDLSEDIRENLHKISNAGNTLLHIVNDILDISKIESREFALTPVEYHMASLLNDTAILISSRIGEKPITFRLNIDEDLPSKLYGDDLRVKQILNNLLSNAIKYTNEGTIELGMHCVREGDNDVWMEIVVKDTGIGIRPEGLENIFSDYNQVDTTANRKVEGTGLGLSITRKLAESMDGVVSVESEYGKGSTFSVRIRQGFVNDAPPIGPVVAKRLRHFRYSDNKLHFVSNLVRADLSYAKVLIVDDLRTNLDVAAGLMGKYKMQVDCVTSGQAAIEKIQRGEPVYNAVFMDHMMPEMDGIEATDRIRALGTEYAQTIPIIALTANAVAGTEELFYTHGFQAFITKPIDIMRLDSIINQWIKDKSHDGILDDLSASQAVSDLPKPGLSPGEKNLIIEIPGIDTEKAITHCAGDKKIFQSILRSYVADVPTIFETLRNVTVETLPAYTIAVHGLKGSSANIGAEEIRAAAANLESMARNRDLSGILAENDVLLQETEGLVAAIKDWLDQQHEKITKPLLPAPDKALLTSLRQCCEQYDLDGAEKAMDELDSANYEKDADLVIWLREKIDALGFSEILERLAEYE